MAGMTNQLHAISHDLLASPHIQHACLAGPPQPRPPLDSCCAGCSKTSTTGGSPVRRPPSCVSVAYLCVMLPCQRCGPAALRLQRRGSSLANVSIQGPFLSRQSCSSAPHVWDGVLVGTTHRQQALSHDLQASPHMQHACFAGRPNRAPLWILVVQGVLKLPQ